jgi:hypothetical protein
VIKSSVECSCTLGKRVDLCQAPKTDRPSQGMKRGRVVVTTASRLTPKCLHEPGRIQRTAEHPGEPQWKPQLDADLTLETRSLAPSPTWKIKVNRVRLPSGPPIPTWSIPGTWVTVHEPDVVADLRHAAVLPGEDVTQIHIPLKQIRPQCVTVIV